MMSPGQPAGAHGVRIVCQPAGATGSLGRVGCPVSPEYPYALKRRSCTCAMRVIVGALCEPSEKALFSRSQVSHPVLSPPLSPPYLRVDRLILLYTTNGRYNEHQAPMGDSCTKAHEIQISNTTLPTVSN